MEDSNERTQRLAAVESFMQGELGMRLRGEPFKIEKCDKLSGKYGSTPMKPSFNDVKARKFTAHASRRVAKVSTDNFRVCSTCERKTRTD
eukprot:1615880-Pyramimonas_sp.AAC.2